MNDFISTISLWAVLTTTLVRITNICVVTMEVCLFNICSQIQFVHTECSIGLHYIVLT